MRNPLGQMKYALDGINKLLPSPKTTNDYINISTGLVNEIYSNVAQGLTSCNRGLQVINVTLNAVSNHALDSDTFEYLSAAAITERAIAEYGFDSPSDRSRVNLKIESDFTFKVDENAYIYIIFNIIKNAVYYFKSYPEARIGIVIDRQKIVISDSGPGIPPQILGKLFKEFTTAGKKNGTGLGLAYCYRTMQAFHGTISCESVVDRYTKFTLDFPMVAQEDIDTHINNIFHEITPFFVNKRILVVDDQEAYHRSFEFLRTKLGCDIDGASSGSSAINFLKKNQYDLVIIDLNMPGRDGYVTTQDIRFDFVPGQKDVCIVAHTSEPYYLAKIKTEKVRMDGFISKPCTRLELAKVLQAAIEHCKQRIFLELASNSLKGKTILITDDELFNRQYLEMYATEWRMKVLHADNGHAALNVLEKVPHVDVIFMDMRMPLMGGIETTQRIRANPEYRDIIIVAVSGNFDDKTMTEAIEAGMNDFITKPLDKTALKQKLIHLLIEKNPRKKTKAHAKLNAAQSWKGAAENTRKIETDNGSQVPGNFYFPLYESYDEFFKDVPLLDSARLADSKSGFKDKFQEFLQRMIKNLFARDMELQTAVIENKHGAILSALHSFIGIAGYIGAHALHQYIKLRLYPVVYEGGMPEEEAWVETVHDLVIKSVEALRLNWVEQQDDVVEN